MTGCLLLLQETEEDATAEEN